ncbi:putative baseplate assembly protein [Streptomyces canus]|uniref:putative baseplate assembly protein n=1 Tax=Streptomyces canus TaxID=58343 RepID=UPI0036C06C04
MALEPPNLDDRTFEQIKREMLLRIPRYTPEWTDWNESDPGVTLIETFAWLAETIGYRLNRAPERCLLTFLDVLGVTPFAAAPARTDLTFTVRPGETAPVSVRARTTVASDVQTPDGPIVFETERGIALLPLRLQSVQVAGLTGFELFTVDGPVPPPLRPFGAAPQQGSACYLGFGPAHAPVTFPDQITLLVSPADRPGALPTDARLQWEYRAAGSDRWSPLDTFEDGTRSFTRHGYVRIAGPRNSVAVAGIGREPRPLHWLRCRLAGGRYAAGQEPVIDLLRYNTVEAVSLTTVTDELAGQSDGRTEQLVRLRNRPVQADTVVVTTRSPDAAAESDEEPWQVGRDLVTSGSQDRHVVLDASRGELHFGDGRNGQVPVAGFDFVVSYRFGGTALANVPAGAVSTLQTAPAGVEAVTNLRRAEAGRDEESAEELREHAASRLRTLGRAVTAEDYRQLARAVGGVADAVAIERRHPQYPGIDVPGAVTVAVLPALQDRMPYASPELLDAVATALDRVRTIGTELFVRSARFVEVAVTAVVEVEPYANFGEIRAEVLRRIDERLSPRAADGTSRFGRDFFPTALFGAVQPIPGVIAVPLLTVAVDGTDRPDIAEQVVIEADQLAVRAADHHITVRPRRDR